MAISTDTPNAYSLRDLPLPAKIVITCFLLAVGAGYFSAMVQLHFQDSKSGEMMPTVHDVILKFTGKKWFETNPPRPVCKLESLITAPENLTFGSSGTMAPAFFDRDGEGFKRAPEAERNKLRPERDGERKVVVGWANASPEVRERAYKIDNFVIEPVNQPSAITPEFKNPDGTFKVKSILDTRCVRCHAKGGSDAASGFPLQTYEEVAKYLQVPPTVTVKEGGGWVKIEEPIGLEKLTQSTHAHLLSFSMLFALTGLVVAFSSYPMVVRCVLGPWVLVFIFADVSLWWLARLSPEWGPYFSMAIIGTGGAVGTGLAAQIVLSLWNMYGIKGRVVLALIFALGAACAGLVYVEKIKPGLEEKHNLRNAQAQASDKAAPADPAATEKPVADKKPAEPKGNAPAPAPKANEKKNPMPPVKVEAMSPIQSALLFPAKGPDGLITDPLKLPWKGPKEGNMVRAFFDKDSIFNKAMKDAAAPKEKEKLLAERHGDLAALTAWTYLPEPTRRMSYEADSFDLPSKLAGKPITGDYSSAGKVKIKTLIRDRCYSCHQDGSDAEKYPFDNYDQILKELQPSK